MGLRWRFQLWVVVACVMHDVCVMHAVYVCMCVCVCVCVFVFVFVARCLVGLVAGGELSFAEVFQYFQTLLQS